MADEVIMINNGLNKQKKKKGIWNKDYFLLWQGQLVSSIGNHIYEIALGFWVLAVTGSTTLMGTLMATSTIPRIIISPFAGVIIDRSNRKWLIVFMDLVRAIAVLFVAYFAFNGLLEIWMVFLAGIILGVCGTFFGPAVTSSIPDIIDKEKIVQGNSFFAMIHSGAGILGSSTGGVLYGLLGAPMMFLINGSSFLFSTFTEIFIDIPKIEKTDCEKKSFKNELVDGLKYIISNKGMKLIFLNAAIINLFFTAVIVLLIPLFKENFANSSIVYGLTMSFFTAGGLLGYILMSALPIPKRKKYIFFTISNLLLGIAILPIAFVYNKILIFVLFFISGLALAYTNNIINSNLMLIIPQDKRGKVFASLATISQGLTPIGMALGGLLAEVFTVKSVVSVSLVFVIISFAMIHIFKEGRGFINYEIEDNNIYDEIKE